MRRSFLLLNLMAAFVYSNAQVPVSKEPRHHVVFANERVRVLNVLLPAGDTTFYHLHSTPSVFINLSKTTTGTQLIHEQPVYSSSVAGNIYFENLSAPHTRYHRVWNLDTSVFHVVDVELLSGHSGFTEKALQIKHVQLLTDTPWVRTYKIQLNNKETLTLNETKRSFLVIAIQHAPIDIVQNGKKIKDGLAEGGFVWLNPGDTFSITNGQKTMMSFALVEVN